MDVYVLANGREWLIRTDEDRADNWMSYDSSSVSTKIKATIQFLSHRRSELLFIHIDAPHLVKQEIQENLRSLYSGIAFYDWISR